MTERAQIPRVGDVLAGGVNALAAVRPHAVQFLETGRYGDIFAIWKSQVQIALARLADECKASRVTLATGIALHDLLQSEFDAVTDPEPQKAVGTVKLYRHNSTTSVLQGGLIRTGTIFSRSGSPSATPPIRSAQYQTVEPFFVPSLNPGGTLNISLRAVATQPGTAANIQSGDPVVSIADNLFDSQFVVQESRAAGGSDGVSVAKLRSLALAISLGQYGPTLAALAAGALLTAGVSRVALREYNDPGYPSDVGQTRIWLCDDSWCWSQQLADTCLQSLRDKWLGFGCKCQINEVVNVPVSLSASILLRDKRYVADTLAIADSVRAACLSYLNDRPDWWTWRERSLAAKIVQSDRRVLAVPTPIVITDMRYNTPITEPTGGGLPSNPAGTIDHLDLDKTKATLTFLTPGASY